MDFEDKLKLVRKSGPRATRSEKINRAWQEISRQRELSTREKLERLIRLTKESGPKKEPPLPAETERRLPLQIFENDFPVRARYGRVPIEAGLKISGKTLFLLSRDENFGHLDLGSALFLDCETTGLSGGVGVVPFLVGLGFYGDNKFHVVQFFLGDLAFEEQLIHELQLFLSRMNFRSVVTFNGKAFDLPLLETRFILHRAELALSGLPHLDFLFAARNLWGHKHESCRLYFLAQEVLGADRAEDIPSAEIPARYFQFLRSGDFGLIEPVLYHNQEDILSLLGIVTVGGALLDEEMEAVSECRIDGLDLFGAARVLERRGDVERSARFIQRALETKLPEDISVLAKKKLASYFKRQRDWPQAVRLWEQVTPLGHLFCFRELAMYYEHREKDYEKARQLAEEGFIIAQGISKSYTQDFSRRLERLKKKLAHRKSMENK